MDAVTLALMRYAAQKGGGSQTIGGNPPLVIEDAKAGDIKKLTQTGLCEQKSVDYLATVTQTGVCEQDGTPTPTVPVAIKCNNGVVKASANLLDPTTVEDENKYVSSTNGTLGTPSSSGGTFRHSDFIRIVGGEDYYFGQTYYKASAAGIAWYTSADQTTFISGVNGTTLGAGNMIATAPSNAQYLRFSIRTDENYDTDWEHTVYVCKNGVMSEFHPYGEVYVDGTPEVITDANGNTATAVNLLGLTGYADTQEILSGAVGRQIGVKVLDGTEGWQKQSGSYRYYITISDASTDNTYIPVCTHFKGVSGSTAWSNVNDGEFKHASGVNTFYFQNDACADATAFAAWLATQYAAGTPVIVLYPLATATTESVTGQILANAPLTVTAEVTVPTLATTTGALSTPDPKRPLPVWCNNGKLAYGVYSTNLCNPAYYQDGGWYVGSNNTVTTANANATLLFPCRPNTTYSWWHTAGAGGCRAFELPTDTVTLGQEAYWAVGNPAYNDAMTVRKYTTSADAKLLCILFGRDAAGVGRTFEQQLADFMLVEGDISVPTQYEPYKFGLHTVGTPEVLTVQGKNLLNSQAFTLGMRLTDTGSTTTEANGFVSAETAVSAGATYTYSQNTGASIILRIGEYDADGQLTKLNKYGSSGAQTKTFTTQANTAYVKCSGDSRFVSTPPQLELGSTATAYEPYSAPRIVNDVPMLLSVGDYKDDVELIGGLLTHKVGVKVLDGTETWGQNATYNRFSLQISDMVIAQARTLDLLCTHYQLTKSSTADYGYIYSGHNANIMITDAAEDTTAFKSFLAAQYAAGTPVMVFYPLATETTESVTPQPLSLVDGTNILTAEAEVSPLVFELTYGSGGSGASNYAIMLLTYLIRGR